jgi:hypothetical protein
MAGFFDHLVTRVARRDIARAQNKRSISTGSVESKSSIEKLSLRLAQPMSRRRALGWLGAAGTAVTAAMTGLLPEMAWAAPPNQGVCAPLKAPGVTSGLYGLCVAYCEALDCPNVTAGATALRRGCKPPDKGVLANYNRLRKASDPQMPCIKSGCPCWTQNELSPIGMSYTPHVVDLFRDEFGGTSDLALVENRVATDAFPYGAFQVAEVDQFADGTFVCRYFNADFAPDPNPPTPIIRVQEGISSADANVCRAQIEKQVTVLQSDGIPVTCTGNACPSQ